MRILGIVLLFGLMPTSAFSGEWALQYLADVGGSRLSQVPIAEAEVTEAFVTDRNGIRLRIRCGKVNLDGMVPIRVTFTIGDGNPFLGPDAKFYAAFDDAPEEVWGEASYAGGGYHGRILGDVFSKLSMNKSVAIRDAIGGFETRFSLENAPVAIGNLHCTW